MKLGIGGVATFKNGKIDKFLNQIDIKHIVLETDSPYLAPTPYRGKRNESSLHNASSRKASNNLRVNFRRNRRNYNSKFKRNFWCLVFKRHIIKHLLELQKLLETQMASNLYL